mgnify:CR=1 FL=1
MVRPRSSFLSLRLADTSLVAHRGDHKNGQAFELLGLPYHLDREYAGIIGQLTHPDTKAHSIDTFIQSDHLFHLDHRA